LRGLAAFYSVRADYKITYDLGQQCLSLAQHQADPVLLLGAHMELGAALFCVGENRRALNQLEQGLALRAPKNHAFLHGQDFRVCCLSRLSTVLWSMGYPAQASTKSREAIALAREVSHPFSLAYALVFDCLLDQLCGRVQETKEKTEAAMVLSTEHGFPTWAAGASLLHGWALTRLGAIQEGIEEMLRGLRAWQTIGAENARTLFLELLAEVHLRAAQTEEGLALLAEMAAAVQKTGERFREAELHRLKGELLMRSDPSKQVEAEECFRQATDIARRQNAKSLELRAAISLSRLSLSRDRKDEARTALGEIYGWFAEGFETEDLRQAKALLEELS